MDSVFIGDFRGGLHHLLISCCPFFLGLFAKFTGQYVVNAQVLFLERLRGIICVFVVFIGLSIIQKNLLIVVIAVH